MMNRNEPHPPLHWQSQLLLLIVVPVCCLWIFIEAANALRVHAPVVLWAVGISVGFGSLVWLLRAATGPAAVTGAVITACLYFRTPGWHTALWPLLAMLVLTLAATRIGRTRKEALGVAENRRGRQAAQVAANLGAAALATLPLTAAQLFSPSAHTELASLAATSAALAEAAADTLSSELGQVFGGQPRLLTTLQAVTPGTDGGITLAGTAAGCMGAATVTAIAALALPLNLHTAVVVFSSAILGLFVDSLLGATLERRGWLNNDAVNFLSTVCAALTAAVIAKP